MTDHPYLDTSHISDFVDDRGPAAYFHGLMKIKKNFNDLIRKSLEEVGGLPS